MLLVKRAENYLLSAAVVLLLYYLALPFVQVAANCWLHFLVEYVMVIQVDLLSNYLRLLMELEMMTELGS